LGWMVLIRLMYVAHTVLALAYDRVRNSTAPKCTRKRNSRQENEREKEKVGMIFKKMSIISCREGRANPSNPVEIPKCISVLPP
jgi:hypothetical protein